MADTKTTKPTETKKVAEPVVLDISDSNVQTKYKDAGKIADGNNYTKVARRHYTKLTLYILHRCS